MNTVAVYRTRNEALRLANFFNKEKIACATINIPSYLKLGCGLSVVFDSAYKDKVYRANDMYNLKSFAGIFPKR